MPKTTIAPDDYRDLLYMRQSVICNFLPKEFALICCTRAPIAGALDILVAKRGQKVGYKHLQSCKLLWGCPVCADRIGRQRRHQLGRAVHAESVAGYQLAFVTYTCQHKRGESLSVVRDRIRYAHAQMHSHRQWKLIQERFGWDGSIRSTEPLYGANGWHYHIHEIAFVDKSTDLLELREALSQRWQRMIGIQGGYASDEHGLDLTDAEVKIKDYIGKWGVVDELTSPIQKSYSNGGIQPFQFADIAVRDKRREKWANELFSEYYFAMKGVKQLCPSKTLRALFSYYKDNPDTPEYDTEILAGMTLAEWRKVHRAAKRGQLLRSVKSNDLETFLKLTGRAPPISD